MLGSSWTSVSLTAASSLLENPVDLFSLLRPYSMSCCNPSLSHNQLLPSTTTPVSWWNPPPLLLVPSDHPPHSSQNVLFVTRVRHCHSSAEIPLVASFLISVKGYSLRWPEPLDHISDGSSPAMASTLLCLGSIPRSPRQGLRWLLLCLEFFHQGSCRDCPTVCVFALISVSVALFLTILV